MLRRIAISFAVVAAATTTARALQATQSVPPPPPILQPESATAPAVESLQVTVTGVEGVVQVRSAEDQPWQKAAVGVILIKALQRSIVQKLIRKNSPLAANHGILRCRAGNAQRIAAVFCPHSRQSSAASR